MGHLSQIYKKNKNEITNYNYTRICPKDITIRI